MRILIYHPVKLPVLQYGGTERVVMWLCHTLKKEGHQVAVLAAPGSTMPPGIECITDPRVALKRARDWDVVHGFTKPGPEFYEAFREKVLVTIQGNGQVGEKFHRNTVFVSRNHAQRHSAKAFVYNGLDPAELKFSEAARPHRYLFLSKTSWRVKNLKGAASLCRRFDQSLWIAGGPSPYPLRAYSAVKPGWKWVGSVNQAQKADFLLEGKAMLFPILWNEPFGIVMTESLVSGTPVIAHPFGSVPEVLEFAPQCLVNLFEKDYFDRISALFSGDVKLPSARECREWVLKNFDQVAMTRKYVSLYEQVMQGAFLHETEPVTKVGAEEIQ